jgi:preprotein translocase subunit SecD
MLFLMLFLLASTAMAQQRPACPAIEIGVVSDASRDSTRSASRSDGTRVLLTGTPLLTNADVTGAHASLTEGVYVLNLDITPDAAKRIQTFSERNVGRVMAFIVEGTVKNTPQIKDPIVGNGILIGAFERADAERLADAINTGCRR